MHKKILSFLLAGTLVLSACPTAVYAAEENADVITTETAAAADENQNEEEAEAANELAQSAAVCEIQEEIEDPDAEITEDLLMEDEEVLLEGNEIWIEEAEVIGAEDIRPLLSETPVLSVPDTLADGTYKASVTVQPNENGHFEAYDITVTVVVSNGAVESVSADGATEKNQRFSEKALDGISSAIIGKSSGAYDVDTVSGATCSVNAIAAGFNAALLSGPVQTEEEMPSEPAVSLASDTAVYNPEGTAFIVTVVNPDEAVDYTDLSISYSQGRFSGDLEKDTDFSVELSHRGKAMDEYTVTILSSSYNTLGQNLSVSFSGQSLGSIAIKSGASVSLANNALQLAGGSGETLADYIGKITSVTVYYTDESGETVAVKYSTVESKENHDIKYTAYDFFHEDGSVNFSIDPFVNGAAGTYTLTVEATGFDIVTGSIGSVHQDSAYKSITVPEGLADGNYTATVKVEPDDDDGFNFYYITVTVTVKSGAIDSLSVSGVSGNNTQYSYRAETGIGGQLSGKEAGVYDVDTVGMATCSSKAIIEAVNEALRGEPTGSTSFTLGAAIYDPNGTTFTVTVTDPEKDTDYSQITLSYALGKFADYLTAGEDYSVALVSESESETVYNVTILNNYFHIDDDMELEDSSYNSLGQNLDVTVAGTSAGRVVITSSAAVSITNNTLTLTGGKGETLADYIAGIGTVAIAYTDENGEEVSTSYTTRPAHDVYPEFTGTDFFKEDGSVNFAIAPFASGADGTYTITVESAGFDTITGTVGGGQYCKHEHITSTITKEATCTSAGEKVYTCEDCGEIVNTEILPKTDHISDSGTVTVKATCANTGVKTYKCTVCQAVIKTEVIGKTSHSWGAWAAASEATVFAAATQTRTCTVCKTTDTQSIGSKLAPSITLSAGSLKLKTGQSTKALKVTGMANGDSVQKVTSNKTGIVKVISFNANGTIKLKAAKKTGTAKITITLASGKAKTIKVTVQKSAVTTTKISGLAKKVMIKKGSSTTLNPVITPITSQQKVTYTSSNKKVATVSVKGVVKAKKKGKAKITVKSGEKKFVVTVTVK